MAKIAFAVGKFDCLKQKHIHLIKEMRKYVFPNGKIKAFILDDYPIFVREQCFPVQNIEQRMHNLKYLVGEDLQPIFQTYAFNAILNLVDDAKKRGDRVIMVAFREDENSFESKFCREHKIQLRFIKPPKEYE